MSAPRILISLGAVFALGVGFGLATKPAHNESGALEKTVAGAEPQPSAPLEQPDPPASQISAPDDFAERLEAILAMPNQYKRARAIAAAADDLSPAEIRDALARLDKVHFHDRDKLLSSLLQRWGELEPKAALEYARKIKADNSPSPVTHVIKGWCESDPAAAEEWIARLPESDTKEAGRAALVESLAVSNPRKAFALFRKAPGLALESLFSTWADTDPQEAAAYAIQLPAGSGRAAAIYATAATWATKDISAALAWAQSVTGKETTASNPPPPVAAVLKEWLDQAPDEAIRWIEQMPDEDERDKLLEHLSSTLSFDDRELAARLVEIMPPGEARDRTMRQIAEILAQNDFSGAVAWLNEQRDVRCHDAIVQALAWRFAGKDPINALELVQSTSGGKGRDQATVDVLKSWTDTDPVAAASWAESHGTDPEQLSSVATFWARRDRQAATHWLASLPPGAMKDDVLSMSASEFLEALPDLAVEWTAGISDESKRLTSYKEIAESWMEWDTRAAKAWMADAPLPADFKTKLLQEYAK